MISNTGYKGIHFRESRGLWQVIVQWRGVLLWGVAHSLPNALRMRNEFERQLGKPHTERRILPDGLGYCKTTSGRKESSRDVVQAHIAPVPGERRTTTYQFTDEGSESLAEDNARRWRRRMEKQYYGI